MQGRDTDRSDPDPAPDGPAPDNPAAASPAPDNPAVDNPAVDNPAPDNPAPGSPAVDGPAATPPPEPPSPRRPAGDGGADGPAGPPTAGSRGNRRAVRRRLIAAAGTVVVVAALAAVAVPLIGGSDVASAHLTTAASPPPPLPPVPLPGTVGVRWSAASVPPAGPASDAGTVVVATAHSLSGRDARTGAERWSYRRDNARLCAWAVQDGAAVALFGKSHGCTEMIALEVGTGARRWYRTAPDVTATASLSSASSVVVARSGDRLLAVDTVTGLNRWTAQKAGCEYGPLVVSQLGAVAVVHCPAGGTRPAATDTVVDHDAYADTEHWTKPAIGTGATVVAVGEATAVLSVLDGGPILTRYDQRGQVLGSIADPRLAGSGGIAPVGLTVADTTLVWTGTAVLAVRTGGHTVAWSAPALGPPTQDGNSVLVARPDGFAELALSGGRLAGRIPVTGGGPAAGAVLSRVGALVIAAGQDGVTAYG